MWYFKYTWHFLYLNMTLDCRLVAAVICSKIEDFRPYIPLIRGLRNPGMRSRHWQMLSERIQMDAKHTANVPFSHSLELGLQDHVADVVHVSEMAWKEYAIEQVSVKHASHSENSI